jgi:hypothetical protein
MLANIEHNGKIYTSDFRLPLDISIPVQNGIHNPNAFGIQPPHFEPFRAGNFVGSTALGGSVNCENIFINAHGNGTHTECVGHITKERITINQTLKHFYAIAQLITVAPIDGRIQLNQVESIIKPESEALIFRTLPNDLSKRERNYSGNNPAFLEPELCALLCRIGIKHLLVDLPSVDPEMDEGKLAAHHAYWNYPLSPRWDATITEMVFVDDAIKDGMYLLNLQIASLESDASPSKPVLYALI